jgi:hypothetical protein
MRSRKRWTLRVALLVLLAGLVPSVAFADNCSGQRDCFASLAAAAAAAAAAGALAGAAAGTMGAAAGAAKKGPRAGMAYQAGWQRGHGGEFGWDGADYDKIEAKYKGDMHSLVDGLHKGIRSLPPSTHVDVITQFAKLMERWGKALGAQEGTAIPGGAKA